MKRKCKFVFLFLFGFSDVVVKVEKDRGVQGYGVILPKRATHTQEDALTHPKEEEEDGGG